MDRQYTDGTAQYWHYADYRYDDDIYADYRENTN
jgi:hypothetical protein